MGVIQGSFLLRMAPTRNVLCQASKYSSIQCSSVSHRSVCATAQAPSSQASSAVVLAFDIMQLGGGAGLAIIMIIAGFIRGAPRLSTWYTFCFSWVVSSFSYCLLCFFGQQTGADPDPLLCVFQAALIYAAPILWVRPFTLLTIILILFKKSNVGTALSFVVHVSLLAGNIKNAWEVIWLHWIILDISLLSSHVRPPTTEATHEKLGQCVPFAEIVLLIWASVTDVPLHRLACHCHCSVDRKAQSVGALSFD